MASRRIEQHAIRWVSLLVLLFLCLPCYAQESRVPGTVFWDGERLTEIKSNIANDNDQADEVSGVIKRLKRATKEALHNGPFSVMKKDELPPSGDKHDYLSFSRYWWPDPDKEDGLPYIRKDGVVNRKSVARGDREQIGELSNNIVPLALSNYLLDDSAAGEHAVRLLRVWFLESKTKMNPNLKYAQGVPGKSDGRGVGILDARGFIWVLDSVALLQATGSLNEDDLRGLKSWFMDYLDWIETSPIAADERRAENNHGSWFAAQISRVAIFVGRDELAKKIVEEVKSHRLQDQIGDDGDQRYELKRTKPVHYCLFNLAALTVVARVAEQLEIDMWDSRLKIAADRLAELACGDESSRPKEIGKVRLSLVEKNAMILLADRCQSSGAAEILDSVSVKYSDHDFSRLQLESK